MRAAVFKGNGSNRRGSLRPAYSYLGGRIELTSRLRSALSPWIDLRERAHVVRDQLEEREFVNSRQFETVR